MGHFQSLRVAGFACLSAPYLVPYGNLNVLANNASEAHSIDAQSDFARTYLFSQKTNTFEIIVKPPETRAPRGFTYDKGEKL